MDANLLARLEPLWKQISALVESTEADTLPRRLIDVQLLLREIARLHDLHATEQRQLGFGAGYECGHAIGVTDGWNDCVRRFDEERTRETAAEIVAGVLADDANQTSALPPPPPSPLDGLDLTTLDAATAWIVMRLAHKTTRPH